MGATGSKIDARHRGDSQEPEEMVRKKSFREDLYRLNAFGSRPSLRERMEDLPELVDFMLQRLNKKQSTGITEISKAMSVLRSTTGRETRELENALHSSSVVSKGKRILARTCPALDKSHRFKESSGDPNLRLPHPRPNLLLRNRSFQSNRKRHLRFRHNPPKKAIPQSPHVPSSISAEEGYDIAYAHARETSQTNLLEVVEKK